jgi:hypothetical protein
MAFAPAGGNPVYAQLMRSYQLQDEINATDAGVQEQLARRAALRQEGDVTRQGAEAQRRIVGSHEGRGTYRSSMANRDISLAAAEQASRIGGVQEDLLSKITSLNSDVARRRAENQRDLLEQNINMAAQRGLGG